MRIPALLPLLTAACIAATSCRREPADTREWRASDHSREDGESAGDPSLPPEDNDPMIAARAVFNTQCAGCHGFRGRGDGPQAAMARPADFTNAALQASRTDDQLRAVITNGRGMMPPFGQSLRPEAVTLLVRLVRQFGGR